MCLRHMLELDIRKRSNQLLDDSPIRQARTYFKANCLLTCSMYLKPMTSVYKEEMSPIIGASHSASLLKQRNSSVKEKEISILS